MRYVIIGNGAAGNAAVEAIRQQDQWGEVTLISDEPHPAYYRPLLPLLIEGQLADEALLRDELHSPPGVAAHLGQRATAIDAREKNVLLDTGERLGYDRLLLATGASPIWPPITGLEGKGVFVLRRLDDAKGIKATAAGARRAVVIGGGRIGAKSALALRHLGVEVTVVEMLPRIVPQQLDEAAAGIFTQALRAQGIELALGQTVRKVVRRRGGEVRGVILEDGRFLNTDLIVVATGVHPNASLARQAGIAIGRGILVDRLLCTNEPDIYAAGNVVETADIVTGEPIISGTWTDAVAMGHCAGENMAGGRREYPGASRLLNAMELAGIPVISVGMIDPPKDGYQTFASRWDGSYRKLVFRDGVLVGFILVGEVERAGVYTTLIRERAPVGRFKEELVRGSISYASFLSAL